MRRGIAKSMSINLTTLGQFFDLHISILNTRVEASSRRVPKENFQFDFISEGVTDIIGINLIRSKRQKADHSLAHRRHGGHRGPLRLIREFW